MPTVAVTRGEERREVVAKAFEAILPEVLARLKTASSILIKPNLVHHENQLASTHVDAVRGVIDVVRAHSQASILVGDAACHGTKAAFYNFGYERLREEYERVELVDLNDDQTVMGWYVKRDGSKGTMGISKCVREAGFTIDLSLMKTHRDVGVSLAMKNWTVGTWVCEPRHGMHGKTWPRWPFLHDQGAWAHHMTIAELFGQHKPDVAVVDAFLAMEGDGPTHGSAVPMHLALAGVDLLALDMIGCRLMGIDPAEIGYLVFAREKGYGVGNEDQITLVGETNLSPFVKAFQKPDGWEHRVLAWRDHKNLKLV